MITPSWLTTAVLFAFTCVGPICAGASVLTLIKRFGPSLGLWDENFEHKQAPGTSPAFYIEGILYCFLAFLIVLPLFRIGFYFSAKSATWALNMFCFTGLIALRKQFAKPLVAITTVFAMVFIFSLAIRPFWATPQNPASDWIPVFIYDDLYTHLQQQNRLAYWHSNGPLIASDGFPSFARL